MRTNKASGLSKLQAWAKDQRERSRSTEGDPFYLQAKEDRIRQYAAEMDSTKQGNASLEQWQQAHQSRDVITDDMLQAWAKVIREGRANSNWNSVLTKLNATGAFPSKVIDKSTPEQKIQRLALEAISRITPPKMRAIAEENLKKGVGHA